MLLHKSKTFVYWMTLTTHFSSAKQDIHNCKLECLSMALFEVVIIATIIYYKQNSLIS